MSSQDQEAELQAFLSRVVPGFPEDCVGAAEDQIERLDKASGGRLPPFYRWFLRTMGGNLGPLQTMLDGFAVRNVLEAHESRVETPPGLFLIAAPDYDDDDEFYPTVTYYDLDHSVRDDALVLVGPLGDTAVDPDFETLREKIGYSSAFFFRVAVSPHYCRGEFRGDDESVSDQVHATCASLGFSAPLAPQRYTKVLEADDVTLVCWMSPEPADASRLFFLLGGPDLGRLRCILGEIADKASIEVKVDRWKHRD